MFGDPEPPSPEYPSADPDFAFKVPNSSIISVQGLRLDSVLAPNIWGDLKPQPAIINVKVYLRKDFASAANADALDDSTIHYGELAKRIRKACAAEKAEKRVLEYAMSSLIDLATKEQTQSHNASEVVMELVLPKASAYGAMLSIADSHVYPDRGSLPNFHGYIARRNFHCKRMRLMVLVGVNEYERRGKQPLVVDLSIGIGGEGAWKTSQAAMQQLFPLEREFAAIVETTEFETLESLSEFAIESLKGKLKERAVDAELVKLRFEKPAAIAFADAAVVEVTRRLK